MALPADQRKAWVGQQLHDDPGQARLLERMLVHAGAEDTGVSEVVDRFARGSAAPRDRSGERIGRYRLIDRIRYGGMAEVYRAARDDGEFEHEVALKVVRSDRVRPELNALFAAERALMARLHHPNIVRLFDGGTTDQGEAWFVMELLDGLPVPAAFEHHALDGDRMLEHLIELAGAVGHIHGQLVVHRDLKPENVLLCRTPQGLGVKVLDFGIAARLSAGLEAGDAATATSVAEGWHSPGYSAPETRQGAAHGAVADVYSLGRMLLDCVALVPAARRAELRAIGERASQEAPEQRYASASAVAEDLARMRRREPISAFRHRRFHVLQRAIERHRWAVAGALFVLIAGLAWLWRETGLRLAAERATVQAKAERDRAEAMRDFLMNAFDAGNPSLNRGEEPRVSDLIVGQLDRLQQASDLDPDAHYALLGSFADLLLHLDRRELADRAYVQAVELVESQGGKGSVRWVSKVARRGQLASRDARYEDAERLFEQARDALDRLPASVDRAREASVLYSSWGASAQRRGKLDEAERLIRIGLEHKQVLQAAGDSAGDETPMRVTLGAIQSARGDLEGALTTFQEAYRAYQAAGQSDTFEHLALLGWLGVTSDQLGRMQEAEPVLIEAVALAEKLFPKANSRLSGSYANLGRLYLHQGRLADAEPLLRKALDVSAAAGDSGTPNHAARLLNLGLLAVEAERSSEAVALLGEALALLEAKLGASHRRTQEARLALFGARAEVEASRSLRAEVDALVAAMGPAPLRVDALLLSARLAAAQGDRPAAEATLGEAMPLVSESKPSAPATPNLRWEEARVRLALGQREAARLAFLEAASLYQAAGLATHPGRGRALLQVALLSPESGPERARLADEARAILGGQLARPSASLGLLDSL